MRRPRSITIIGIIGVGWGILGTLGGIVGAVLLAFAPDMLLELLPRASTSQLREAFKDPLFRGAGIVAVLIPLGINILLLIGSIRLLRLHPVGWWLMMVYAVLAILWAVAERVLNAALYESFRQRYQLQAHERPTAGVRVSLGLLYPVAVSFILTRRKIMKVFRQEL